MPPVTNYCLITGIVSDPNGNLLSGVIVTASSLAPYVYPDLDLFVAASQVSVTTDTSGYWQLTLLETTSTNRSVTIEFQYSDGGSGSRRDSYTIVVPPLPQITFAELVTIP